ncbi:MAG: PorV/PorQ family protein [Flavobacteriales bacterium]|nr:PorV/PorQ family protein [Flavobacteriales bacterium]
MKIWAHILVFLIPIVGISQVLPKLGSQRTGVAAMTYLKNDGSPRSLGMAGANLTLDNDGFTPFTNPATTTSINKFGIGMSNYFFGAGANQTFVSAVYALPSSGSAFSFSVNNFNSGEQKVRTEFQPEGTGELFYVNMGSAGLGYSKKLSDQFSFGLNLKYVYEFMVQYQSHTVAADLGFIYHIDVKDLAFAVAVSNFGGSSALKGDYQEVTFGNTTTPTPDKYPLPTEFKIGVSMIPYKTDKHAIMTAIQLNHPNDNAENFRIGIEYGYRQLLFLRTGIVLGRLSQKAPTMGAGVNGRVGNHPIQINYSVAPMFALGWQHQAGISFSLHKTEERQ